MASDRQCSKDQKHGDGREPTGREAQEPCTGKGGRATPEAAVLAVADWGWGRGAWAEDRVRPSHWPNPSPALSSALEASGPSPKVA